MTFALPSNMTGLYSLGTYVNSITDGYFWTMILIAIYGVMFFSTKAYGSERAFGYCTFVGAVMSILLFTIGFVPTSVLVASVILAGIGIVALKMSNSKEY